MDNDPIYVYDTRTQFERPVFIAFEERDVDVFLKARFDTYTTTATDWKRPDWVFVTMQRMHENPPPRYGTRRSSGPSYSPRESVSTKNAKLTMQVMDMKKKLSSLEKELENSRATLERWKASNMDALRDLAVDILTKKDV